MTQDKKVFIRFSSKWHEFEICQSDSEGAEQYVPKTQLDKANERIKQMKASAMSMMESETAKTKMILKMREEIANLKAKP